MTDAIENNSYGREPNEGVVALAEGQNIIKSSLFNLIVISHDPERAVHCQDLIRIIIEKFPCRIIFVRADPMAHSDFMRTTKSVQITGSGSNCVLCDQITIEASCNQFPKIPFLILPHIQPDLPIYILLGHTPEQDRAILPQIQRYASRVAFDPEVIENFALFSQQILILLQNQSCDFIDMNWARTKAWREVLASAFNTSEAIEQLKHSKTIQISYVCLPNQKKIQQEIQAIYIQAWLASRLNWNVISIEREENCIKIFYKYDHQSVTISLVPKDTGILQPGAIFSFEVLTEGDAHFLLSHESDNKLVKVHASNPERCEIPYTIFLSNYQNGPALVGEVFYQSKSDHYAEMLQLLSKTAVK